MSAFSLRVPATIFSPYHPWYRHFLKNRDGSRSLPWHDPDPLSAADRRLVSRSIQQFQLDEWARGRGLLRRASSHAALTADPWFLPALKLFIAEEQEHSRILGRFLYREGIPQLENHWMDGISRRLWKLAGLDVSAMVLITAEVLAMPFYRALGDATRSYLLRSICRHILRDEAAHLSYQALTLGLVRRRLWEGGRIIRSLCHSALFHGTAVLLWQEHRRVFQAAGWGFRRFWGDSRREFIRLQLRIRQVSDRTDRRI